MKPTLRLMCTVTLSVAVTASSIATFANEVVDIRIPTRQSRDGLIQRTPTDRHFRAVPGKQNVQGRIVSAIRDALTSPSIRLPGEFEMQQFLLLSCGELTPQHAEKIAEIARATCHSISVVVLADDESQRTLVQASLMTWMVPADRVQYLQVSHDTKWIRDYGPIVVSGRGGNPTIVDLEYGPDRPNDDVIPARIGTKSRTLVQSAPLVMEGGNLLSNGQGLCITTRLLLDVNAALQYDEHAIRRLFRNYFGAKQTVFLEPLAGEPSGHVDMFATFAGANTVVVGSYDPKVDAENAAILDRNADRLAQIVTPQGKLCVERMPMGSHRGNVWRTYTNCIYANGVLLVPTYHDDDAAIERAVVDKYRRLLPGWRIVPIDATDLIAEGGALHCISMNVPKLLRLEATKRLIRRPTGHPMRF